MKAASTIAHSGMLVVIIEASPGDVMLTPNMKLPWLSTMAKSEAKNSLTMSLWSTCSGFRKSDTSQNSSIAPPMRISVTTHGVTAPLAITTFDTGDISPHIAFAPNMAACPLILKSITLALF